MTDQTPAADIVEPCTCGGAPQIRQSSDGEVEWVRCTVCGREGPVHYDREKVIAGWNAGEERRPVATEIEALRAREAELQRKLDEAVEAVIDLRRAACRLPGVTMALGEHLDALDAALSSESAGPLPDDVRRLVIAVRDIAYTDAPEPEAILELAEAVAAFDNRVDWDDQPSIRGEG